MKVNKLYTENCLKTLKRMPDNYLDLTVTSPPYDDLRDYKGYSFPFEDIAKQLYRVTKKGGVVVWIIGDATIDGSETGTSFKQALFFKECGFNLHDTMLYRKNGASYPSHEKSVRYSQIFEYMFVLSKGKPKSINLLKDRKNRWAGSKSFGKSSTRSADGELKTSKQIEVQEFGYRENIWKYNTGKGYSSKDEIVYDHPAIFPELLAADHIKSWSNKGDLVYDPFGGSGTTGKMAHLLERNWILSEISEEYSSIINKRMKKYLEQGIMKFPE